MCTGLKTAHYVPNPSSLMVFAKDRNFILTHVCGDNTNKSRAFKSKTRRWSARSDWERESFVALDDVSWGAGLGSLCEQIFESLCSQWLSSAPLRHCCHQRGSARANTTADHTKANQRKDRTQVQQDITGSDPLGKAVTTLWILRGRLQCCSSNSHESPNTQTFHKNRHCGR